MKNFVDFIKLAVGSVSGAIAILMMLGIVSLPAKAHHGGVNGQQERFVQCTYEECKDKGRFDLYSKLVVNVVEDSPAVVLWLQGGEGRVSSLNFGPIEYIRDTLTVVGLDPGYRIPNKRRYGPNTWGGPGRWNKEYVARIKSAVMWIKQTWGYDMPIFIMGHSAGAQGVSGYLMLDPENQTLVTGGIWSGGNDVAPYPGKRGMKVKQLDLPALIIHHAKDKCPSTSPRAAKKRYKKYKEGLNAGPTELVLIEGGATGGRCGVHDSAHGYVGVKDVYTEAVLKFIMKYAGQQ